MGPMAKVEFYDGRMNIHSHFSGHQWAMGDFGHFVLRNVENYDQKNTLTYSEYTGGASTIRIIQSK